jgi:apolipoprotein N-acyltransferase
MKNNLEKYGLPVLSGILLSWAFPRFHWFWLAWVALVPLFWTALRANPRGAAFQFFLAGWVFHSILLQWLCANIFWAGGWAILGQQLLCMFLGLHWAAVGFAWRWLEQRHPRLTPAGMIVPLWWGMEWLMAHWFTGFGWSALGYSQGACLPIAQWAAGSSVSVISILIVLVNILLALALLEPPCLTCMWPCSRSACLALALVLFERMRLIRFATAAVVMAVILGGGSWSLSHALPRPADPKLPPLKVGLVQPSLSQEVKWDADFNDFTVDMMDAQTRGLAKEGPMDLVVWPEAAVPGDLAQERTLEPLRRLTRDTGTALLTGITRNDPKARKSYNTAFLLTPQGEITGFYDKVHLAPFGEYIPFEKWLPFLRGIAFGGVDAGTELKLFQVGDRKVGPLICFEVLFPSLASELKKQGADFLAVMTNLAWFGQSNAMLQELELARFRAIETGLPLVHSANTGISGVFDGFGRFTPVSDFLGRDGNLIKYPAERIAPAMVQGQRVVGIFTLPQPIVAYPAVGITVLLVCFIAIVLAGVIKRGSIQPVETDTNRHKK